MTDWSDRLSDYLDGDMSGDERARLEAVLADDAELRRVHDELRALREAASRQPRPEPENDLWPGIEARIRTGRVAGRPRRLSLTLPQLAAAAVALLVVGGTSMWLALGSGPPGEPASTAGGPTPGAGFVSLQTETGSASYRMAVRDLEEQLRLDRGRLDPKTVEAVERSLTTIDRAIDRAREALEADPASVYLNRHLAEARARKLSVLQQAALLASS